MKKVILLLVAVLAFNLSNAQELKGYVLGSTYEGNVSERNVSLRDQTVGGIDGTILLGVLNDKRIHSIYFVPDKRMGAIELERLVSGLEAKYDVILEPNGKQRNRTYSAYFDDSLVFINTEYNQFMSPSTKVTLIIQSDKLKKIDAAEKQLESNKDF